jgi:hypothetical protein
VVESQPSKLLVAGSIPVSRSRNLVRGDMLEMVGFQQATIKVEKEQEFGELKAAIARAFAPEKVEKLLKKVQGKGLRIRNLEPILQAGIIEQVDEALAKSGKLAGKRLYGTLPLSDQAQMREFYLFKLEEVRPELRARYQKIYRYY